MEPYYDSDGITVYVGDCLDVLPTLGEVDLVLTDPPYLHGHVDGGGFASARRFYRDGALDGLQDFDLSHYEEALLAAAPMLIAYHSRDLIPAYADLARRSGRKYDLHVWHKTNAIPFTANTWKSDIEYVALIWARKPGWKQLHQSLHSKVFSSPIERDNTHPTVKPIPMLKKYIQVLDAQTILDPFAGSLTTAAAAYQLGRRCIAIEREQRYVDAGLERLRQGVLI